MQAGIAPVVPSVLNALCADQAKIEKITTSLHSLETDADREVRAMARAVGEEVRGLMRYLLSCAYTACSYIISLH